MNYELIKILCKRKRISQNELIKLSGLTSPGFYMGIKKESFTISTLEKIANALNVNPCVFFKENLLPSDIETTKNGLVSEPVVNYETKINLNKNASSDMELIELMRFKIKTLEMELSNLKENSKQ